MGLFTHFFFALNKILLINIGMSSYTLVPDSTTSSLTSSGGLSANAAITLARLVCDTTIGTDDLVNVNSQNIFVLDLIAAVGPVVAFNAICRQLLKIKNIVALPYSGSAYAPIADNVYSNYLTSYVMRDTALLEATSFPATFTFLPEQFQTLAAFANAGVNLSDMIQVVDYHILMIYLAGLTATGIDSLVYTNLANPYSSTYSFSKYLSSDNISRAKYLYAISSLAQTGGDDLKTVSPEFIAAGVLVDPVYTDADANNEDNRIYGLIASISILVAADSKIRTKYDYLTKPVVYSLAGVALTRNVNATSSKFTISRMINYSNISAIKNIYYYKTFDRSTGNVLPSVELTPGLVYTPSAKPLVTYASLSEQSAQSIYTILNLSSENATVADSGQAISEIASLKSYGKTIADIRAITDSNKYLIPAFNNPDNFLAAGYSKKDISDAFAGLTIGTNYDFAVLIKVCKYVKDTNTANTTRMKPDVHGNGYNFDIIDTSSTGANAVTRASIVSKLKIILLASNDAVFAFSSISSNNAKTLLANVKDCFNEFTTTSNITTTAINSANAELAVLRFLHTSASGNATIERNQIGSITNATYKAFTASNDLPNMYAFSNLSVVISSSSNPSNIKPSDFLTSGEFGAYSKTTSLSLVSPLTLTNGSTTTNYLRGPVPGERTNDNHNGGSNSYWMKTSQPDGPQKQFYSLGYVTKHYYNATTSSGTTVGRYFDNGASFEYVYAYMTPSTAGLTKIDGIKTHSWPQEIVFSYPSLLLTDTVSHTMKKMNPNTPTNISDALLLSTYSTSGMWCTLSYLLFGPIRAYGTTSPNAAAKFDNISYKKLLTAGATAQYIKVDLARNVDGITDAEFGGLGLPMDVALYVAKNSGDNGITIKEIAKNNGFSRYSRRKTLFSNVTEAAQQLDAETFINLVWSPAEIALVVSGNNPLNITVSDLLTLSVESNEITSDYYVIPNQQKRLAYHTVELRKGVVGAFYPNLSPELTSQLAALYDPDEILDFISNIPANLLSNP